MSGKGSSTPKPEAPIGELDKEVIHLPDGRELTYYRFPEEPARAAPATPKKER